MQMDGTYGMTGGMSEMLVQSHAGQIELLPALPSAWENGYVKGIRARGDITIDMTWKNGKVTKYQLTSATNKTPVTVIVNGKQTKVTPSSVAANDTDRDQEEKKPTKKGKKKTKKKKKTT
jgi:alpha-L-fucosidase 2